MVPFTLGHAWVLDRVVPGWRNLVGGSPERIGLEGLGPSVWICSRTWREAADRLEAEPGRVAVEIGALGRRLGRQAWRTPRRGPTALWTTFRALAKTLADHIAGSMGGGPVPDPYQITVGILGGQAVPEHVNQVLDMGIEEALKLHAACDKWRAPHA
jgi:hypothetical protein